nr:ATP-dependent RNA helicase dbp2-like [Arachis hypogaea]
MEDDPNRIYRLGGVAHITDFIYEEPYRCITSMRRQHDIFLEYDSNGGDDEGGPGGGGRGDDNGGSGGDLGFGFDADGGDGVYGGGGGGGGDHENARLRSEVLP